jgi:hypothetical protein
MDAKAHGELNPPLLFQARIQGCVDGFDNT